MWRVSGEATSTATAAAKAALRTRVRAGRGRRAEQQPAGDRHTDAVLLADAVLAGLRGHLGPSVCRVAAYVARLTEPPTDVLVDGLVQAGYEVVLPVTQPDLDLDWRHVTTPELLGPDALATAAVVVVPALAVDRGGRRLGQGGGSYDRALLRRAPAALVVALLNDDELLPEGSVPVDAHDVPLDAAVAPRLGWVDLRR
jgi:5-formyltetrahydrofolate cyclo-ligase